MRPDLRRLQPHVPDLALGGATLVIGLVEAAGLDASYDGSGPWLVVVATAVAVGLSRRAPGAALALVWVTGLLQVASGTTVLLVQLAIGVVLFGTARWGSVPTLWAGALSIPGAMVAALGVVLFGSAGLFGRFADTLEMQPILGRVPGVVGGLLVVGIVGLLVLGAPWLAGLALRSVSRAQASRVSQMAAEEDAARAHRESEQAREIARLREEQARLARDVHDVVGHSLAVILAQAESAQYLPDADPERLKQTMATIATSARSSLQDVRGVLGGAQDAPAPARDGGLDALVDGVRAAGHEVVSTVVGRPQPLPPELQTVAYRVLQEMLTNAMRHGRRGTTIAVERHWEGELRLEVRNVADGEPVGDTQPLRVSVAPPAQGQGVPGMRRRLESVGGRLDVRRREEGGVPTFTATAWVPLRGGA